MKYFTLTRPCELCPFRTDCLPGWLGKARAAEIVRSITRHGESFPCHETTEATGHGADDHRHCAGALIHLTKIDRPNTAMQLAERLDVCDFSGLKMDAPVFDTPGEFISHHS